MRIADLVRLVDAKHRDCEAFRFSLHVDGVVLRECYARRNGDSWTIFGPIRREHGRSVPLTEFSAELRTQIACALDAEIAQNGEVAA